MPKGTTLTKVELDSRDEEIVTLFKAGTGWREMEAKYGVKQRALRMALGRKGISSSDRRRRHKPPRVKAPHAEVGSRFYNIPEHLVIINPYSVGVPVTLRDDFAHLGD